VLLTALAGGQQEPPHFTGKLNLVRYDLPLGNSDGYAPTRHLAQRKDGSDAVDWPDFTLNGKPIFRAGAEEERPLLMQRGAQAAGLFQREGDNIIQPGNHWFRAIEWLSVRRHLYTADRSARTSASSEAAAGRYELWLFPIVIEAEGAPAVKNVKVKSGAEVIYRKPGPWRSLTLLLPASEADKPYEVTVDGRPAVQLHAGLQPVKLGDPRELTYQVEAVLGGEGPKIVVKNLSRPTEFPHAREWADDVAALGQPIARPSMPDFGRGLQRHLCVDVPRSPLTIYTMALPHGMSGGFYRQGMDVEAYAQAVAEIGYDAVFDQAGSLPPPGSPESMERRAAALAKVGVRLGLQYGASSTRASLQHPNLGLFSHTLPEWHAPLYRSLQLAAQRLARLPNFIGISIGGENAGYVSTRPNAPPAPDRPWGEAMMAFMETSQPQVLRAPSLGPAELPFEKPAVDTAEFIKYVNRYDATYQQYGYFAEAVREVDERLIFTTASYGSSPGKGARGGWPWASIPGRVMFQELNTQQAHDVNRSHAAKPLHHVALLDRLRSYEPEKRTWALVDNYRMLYGREAFQRANVLALTRGVQGLGTNFLAANSGDTARPEVAAFQKEFYSWVRKYGGVYSMMEPESTIGVFFGHHQAVLRGVVAGEAPPESQLYSGSHEGKVTEALFLCHAAGWPARVITYQEMMRGPLPDTMKAILLVGLHQPDRSWHWAPGLAPALQQFVARGGRILADDDSVAPVPVTSTGMRVAAYVSESDVDATPLLFERNRANISLLRKAMEGTPLPVAASENPRLWAIPTKAGDTLYITAVNQNFAEGEEAREMLRLADLNASKPEVWKTKANASLYVKPHTGTLRWSTDRPIYDVRLRRRITAEEAAVVDLTREGFQWYALPPAELVLPDLSIERGVTGFYEAKPTMQNGTRMDGIPVEITVTRGEDTATVYGATGATVRLPLRGTDAAGEYQVTVTELLSGEWRRVPAVIP
jgi:hypothetical protein